MGAHRPFGPPFPRTGDWDIRHYIANPPEGGPVMILTQPLVKFIDYGNAVFDGDKKPGA